MSKTFSFKTQLAVGVAGEKRFLAHYQDVRPLDGRRGDFQGNSGRPMEIKFDSRRTDQTPNFFVERWGNIEKKKPGSVWQSKEHGCFYFVYTFACGAVFWFEVDPLLAWLEQNVEKYPARVIQNYGFAGMGYLVPRADVEHLAVKVDQLPPLTSRKTDD
jgi:hypothetical protein